MNTRLKLFRLVGFTRLMIAAVGVLVCASVSSAQIDFAVLHAFTGTPDDGANPSAALIQATNGNLYGTTRSGGAFNFGTVFTMTPDGTVTVLQAFTGANGAGPESALIQANDGNFYGTTRLRGAFNFGTVFMMAPDGTVTVLHAFSGADGAGPEGALIQATNGTFYGTTGAGGGSDLGTIFTMALDGTFNVLHAFTGGTDGATPHAGVIQAGDGNFYGTTGAGGDSDRGTVFRMTADGALTVLHAFTGGADGATPHAGVMQAADGNFYGTTFFGGPDNRGTLFTMTPNGAVTVLHAFTGGSGGPDGACPDAALIQATDGHFYGTTRQGSTSGFGTIFRMFSDGTTSTLHAFANSLDGSTPRAGLFQATNGNLYGATVSDDATGSGVAFRLATLGPTKDRANSYDNAWKSAWVTHARFALTAPGKTDGFVLEIGDSITHSFAYAIWPKQGDGQTAEDNEAITWAHANSWSADAFDVTNKNGWYLADADTTFQRGMTSSGGLSTGKLVSGCCNGGPDMPATIDPVTARQIIANATYTGNIQIDTLISAFNDAQFGVVMLGTNDPANPNNLSALITIVDKLEAQHIVPILCTIPPRNDSFSNRLNVHFNAAVTDLAQQRSLPIIDFYQEILLRRPGTTWFTTLISDDGLHPTASGAGFSPDSNPYVPGGVPVTHTTGDAVLNVGYLLRGWLTVQKLKEAKRYVIEGIDPP